MTLHVRDAGAWKEVTQPSVRDAGAWKDLVGAYVKDAGSWKQFWAPAAPPATLTVTNTTPQSGTHTGGTTTGTVSRTNSPAASASGGTAPYTYSWARISGPSSVGAFTITNGSTATPTWSRSGIPDGTTVTETWRVTATDAVSNTGTKDVVVNLTYYYSDPGGGGGGCPFCCFAPGTQIVVEDMAVKSIEDVQPGDRILTANGYVPVTEVIIRTRRPMFRLTFDDGRTIETTDDHPFYVEGKGYSSLNPTVPYKDIGVPATLMIGDGVSTIEKKVAKLVAIEEIECPPLVYTFAESDFYANGLLVC